MYYIGEHKRCKDRISSALTIRLEITTWDWEGRAYLCKGIPAPKQPYKGTVSYSISMFEVLETLLILVFVRVYYLNI